VLLNNKPILYAVRCVRGEQQPAHTFTDNGDGTVTDNSTGLMWEKCSAGQNNDTACTNTATEETYWQQALYYCKGLSLAGYTDWRLPNIKELRSIVVNAVYGPAIDTTYFPNTAAPILWWSSTTYASYPSEAWDVYLNNGSVSASSKSDPFYHSVRCVR